VIRPSRSSRPACHSESSRGISWSELQLPSSEPTSFFSVIANPRSYLNILYLPLGLPLGTLSFTVLVTGFSVGLSMLVVALLGIPILIGFWYVVRGLMSLERGVAIGLLDEDIASIGSGPFKVEVDLMQPIDPESRPKVHDPSLNHVGLWVDDLPAAVEWLTGQGVRFTPGGIRKGASGYDVCFVHPKGNDESPIGAAGVLVELVQAPEEVREAFAREA